MSDNVLDYEIAGLKCDNASCDYIDYSVTFDRYPEFLNAPCPMCGANLLTQADLDTTNALVATCKAINSAFADTVTPEVKAGGRVAISVNLDGSGIPKFQLDGPISGSGGDNRT